MNAPANASSRHYDTDDYRARPTDVIAWHRVARTPRQDCDECGALRHETRGASGRPAHARHRRTITAASDLLLCATHAELWHARDDTDTEPARYRRRTR